jgi:hypothetical protein
MNTGGVALVNTNIVQHGRLLQKLYVDRQFTMFPDYLQTTVGHLPAMLQ